MLTTTPLARASSSAPASSGGSDSPTRYDVAPEAGRRAHPNPAQDRTRREDANPLRPTRGSPPSRSTERGEEDPSRPRRRLSPRGALQPVEKTRAPVPATGSAPDAHTWQAGCGYRKTPHRCRHGTALSPRVGGGGTTDTRPANFVDLLVAVSLSPRRRGCRALSGDEGPHLCGPSSPVRGRRPR